MSSSLTHDKLVMPNTSIFLYGRLPNCVHGLTCCSKPREMGCMNKYIECYISVAYFSFLFQENGINVTHVQLNVTELRIHPNYSIYVNWSQSLVLGFIPAALLMYFNTKIYLDVR